MKSIFRIISLLLIAAALISAAGCTGPAVGPDPTDAPRETEASVDKSFDPARDMAIVIDGKTYKVGMDADELVSILGDGYEYRETISCTRNGMEKTYQYDGLRIDTLPTDNGDVICLFVISGGEYKTARGVGIGTTKDELFEAYGEYYFDGYYYVFTESNDPANIGEDRIQVVLENDAVFEINVYSPDYAK